MSDSNFDTLSLDELRATRVRLDAAIANKVAEEKADMGARIEAMLAAKGFSWRRRDGRQAPPPRCDPGDPLSRS